MPTGKHSWPPVTGRKEIVRSIDCCLGNVGGRNEENAPKAATFLHCGRVYDDGPEAAQAPSPSGGGQLLREAYLVASRGKLAKNLDINPMGHPPRLLEARRISLELGDRDGCRAERLGKFGRVYKGPRCKRPYADPGVTSSESIVRYFTGNATTHTRGENVKSLDLAKGLEVLPEVVDRRLERGGGIAFAVNLTDIPACPTG